MSFFGSKKPETSPQSSTPSPAAPSQPASRRPAPSPSPSPARPAPAGSHRTHVATGSKVVGKVTGDAELVIDGHLDGEVELKSRVVVGEKGTVDGTIRAVSVQLAGKVAGNVEGEERVEVLPSGSLEGDVTAPRVMISDGAFFKGKVEMTAPKPIQAPSRQRPRSRIRISPMRRLPPSLTPGSPTARSLERRSQPTRSQPTRSPAMRTPAMRRKLPTVPRPRRRPDLARNLARHRPTRPLATRRAKAEAAATRAATTKVRPSRAAASGPEAATSPAAGAAVATEADDEDRHSERSQGQRVPRRHDARRLPFPGRRRPRCLRRDLRRRGIRHSPTRSSCRPGPPSFRRPTRSSVAPT